MDTNCATTRRKNSVSSICPKEEKNASLKKVSTILQKPEDDRSFEEQQTLVEYSEVVEDLKMRWHRRDEAKRRLEEIEEPLDVIEDKCRVLVEAIAKSEHLVVYTGAGISTAACIPDYRGTNGIWTRLQQGKDIGKHDLSLAEPTITHMALAQLHHKKILKYVVSQNCDGLHLRSGLPRTSLSELHGNMYIEVCKSCKPVREYWRLFDVTENTARYQHKTMRRCYTCNGELQDTIVHFGERGTLQWPLNWPGACKNADKADTILCLGSSLKVLKKYPHLWQMNKPAKKRPNLFIVNLQWTPKDDGATLKINGKCDEVLRIIMDLLGLEIPKYSRESDPIFHHATVLNPTEKHTTNQPDLNQPNLDGIENSAVRDLSVRHAGRDFSGFAGAAQEMPHPLLMAYYYNLLYPTYPTSLFYSGLHNIINPFLSLNLEPNCNFCFKSHHSLLCMFYVKHSPVFEKKLFRLSKKTQINRELSCVCCDFTTDDDSDDEDDDDPTKKLKIDETTKLAPVQAPCVQAGWFGKGYKKNRKVRKKTTTLNTTPTPTPTPKTPETSNF